MLSILCEAGTAQERFARKGERRWQEVIKVRGCRLPVAVMLLQGWLPSLWAARWAGHWRPHSPKQADPWPTGDAEGHPADHFQPGLLGLACQVSSPQVRSTPTISSPARDAPFSSCQLRSCHSKKVHTDVSLLHAAAISWGRCCWARSGRGWLGQRDSATSLSALTALASSLVP